MADFRGLPRTSQFLIHTMVSQADLERAIHEKLGHIDTLFVSDVSGGCGQAFDVVIVSEQFEGKRTLQRHRLVNDCLKDEIASMHAFSQKTYTPKQFEELKFLYSRQTPSEKASVSAPAPSLSQPTGMHAETTPKNTKADGEMIPKIDIPARINENIHVPELTLTPVSESKHPFRSYHPELEAGSASVSSVDIRHTSSLEGTGISRLHHATIANPSFWQHLRELLRNEVMQEPHDMNVDDDAVSQRRNHELGASEVEQLFEDFFLTQKNHLSANDIARIRDITGMHGMSS
mgnify:CR=1 FL=1